MRQTDIDLGRLIALVDLAPVKPAGIGRRQHADRGHIGADTGKSGSCSGL
jgi:hypothetical protein